MRGKSVKLVSKWANQVWSTTPEDQRTGFRNYSHFRKRIKKEWKTNPQFKTFIKSSIENGIV